jgi:hypothetical protein
MTDQGGTHAERVRRRCDVAVILESTEGVIDASKAGCDRAGLRTVGIRTKE